MSLFNRIEDFRSADMPARQSSFWKLAGPSAVLVGLSIGAGEIIIWPRIVAEYGATMVWAAVLGVFLQLWVNFEIGRYTIATGETIFTGYLRLWPGFAPLMIALTVFGYIAPGWARASGLALKALTVGPTGGGSDFFWTSITFAAVALILFGPKIVYRSVERSVTVLIVIVTLGLIVVAAAVSSASTWRDLGAGLVNVGYIAPGMDIRVLFSALVFAGAGGVGNLFYTFYLRDKNIGMGARIPALSNPLRGGSKTFSEAGYNFPDTPSNRAAFASWWRYLRQDQMLFFWGLNTFTMLLFIVGALAVLHPNGLVPEPGTLIWDEAAILGEIWGGTGRALFLVIGLATLLSTQLVVVDGVARSISDILHTSFTSMRKRDPSELYVLIAGAWMVSGCAITWLMESRGTSDLGFIMNSAYMGGFAMAVYVPATLVVNRRLLPDSARPGRVCTTMMIIASAVYIGFALSSILWEIRGG